MEKSYIYPPYIRFLGVLLIVLALIIAVILIIVAFVEGEYGLLAFTLLFAAVFIAIGMITVRTHSMIYTLSRDGITVTGPNRQQYVPYEQIRSVSHKTVFASALVLDTAQGQLKIRKNLVNYPDFAQTLKTYVPAIRSGADNVLSFRCRAWEMYVCAGIFLVLSLGFVVLILIGLITGETSVAGGVVIIVVLLPFVIVLGWAILKAARSYVFEPDGIKKVMLAGEKYFKASDIKSVEYGQKKPKSGSRFGSPVLHFIDLRFHGTKAYVWADQTMTDFPIDEIKDYVKAHYPVQNCWTEVTLDQAPKL